MRKMSDETRRRIDAYTDEFHAALASTGHADILRQFARDCAEHSDLTPVQAAQALLYNIGFITAQEYAAALGCRVGELRGNSIAEATNNFEQE